jgi:hypothetical protein
MMGFAAPISYRGAAMSYFADYRTAKKWPPALAPCLEV